MAIRKCNLKNLSGCCASLNRRIKSYRPLKEDMVSAGPQLDGAHTGSGASMVWNLLNRRGAVDNCPLLQDRPVWARLTQPNTKPSIIWLASYRHRGFYTFLKKKTCFLNSELNECVTVVFESKHFLELYLKTCSDFCTFVRKFGSKSVCFHLDKTDF